MHIVQRMLLLLMIILLLTMGLGMVCREKESRLRNQWERIQTQLFLQKICRNRSLVQEEFISYVYALNCGGTGSEIIVEQYRAEQDLAGNLYYYLISWEELQKILWQGKDCIFEPGSIIRIKIGRQHCYYGMITEEG